MQARRVVAGADRHVELHEYNTTCQYCIQACSETQLATTIRSLRKCVRSIPRQVYDDLREEDKIECLLILVTLAPAHHFDYVPMSNPAHSGNFDQFGCMNNTELALNICLGGQYSSLQSSWATFCVLVSSDELKTCRRAHHFGDIYSIGARRRQTQHIAQFSHHVSASLLRILTRNRYRCQQTHHYSAGAVCLLQVNGSLYVATVSRLVTHIGQRKITSFHSLNRQRACFCSILVTVSLAVFNILTLIRADFGRDL